MRSFTLNPKHPAGRFCRTSHIADREPRLVIFTAAGTVELDPQEAESLAKEIALGFIGLLGVPFAPKPKPEAPILDAQEDLRDADFNRIDPVDDWHTPLAWAKGWLVGRFGRR